MRKVNVDLKSVKKKWHFGNMISNIHTQNRWHFLKITLYSYNPYYNWFLISLWYEFLAMTKFKNKRGHSDKKRITWQNAKKVSFMNRSTLWDWQAIHIIWNILLRKHSIYNFIKFDFKIDSYRDFQSIISAISSSLKISLT